MKLPILLALAAALAFGSVAQEQKPAGEPPTPFPRKGKYGYRDKHGEFVIEPQFDYAGEFSEGLAVVGLGKFPATKWGYINREGKVVIPAQFDGAHDFSEGMAAVGIGGKLGYIDRTGKLVVPPQFDEAQKFSGGRARVRIIKEGYGYISKTGERVVPLQP
ncbi:MAG: KWG repeat protein [Limisphaerales bacterium]|nr:MAG: KWG repeat protein [Limisphaerales bacterium]KAG0507302.1 MAG: KWG repeat protein [Limisphaerales bacterium]TXT44762.1 MAG: KWG repeat protein [Limisphaerales bacterium]